MAKQNAIIYVRGDKKEMQEAVCLLYANEVGYKVLFTTTDIYDVYNCSEFCDVLLVTNGSRISRDKMEYYNTLKDLEFRKIKLESVSNGSVDSIINHISLAYDLTDSIIKRNAKQDEE